MAGTGIDLFAVSQSQFGIARTHFGPDGKGSEGWRPWTSVDTEVADSNPGAPGLSGSRGIFLSCARSLCGATAGNFQLCQSNGARLYHALRRPDGVWTPFGDVMNAVPPGGTPNLIDIPAVALINEDLHVCAVDANGGGRLFYTIRLADGTWPQPFEDVIAAVLAQNPGSIDPGSVDSVACAAVFGELYVMVGALPAPRRILYTIRHVNGTWGPFGDVLAELGQYGWNPPAGAISGNSRPIALTELDGQLHLCFSWQLAGPPYGVSALFHAARLSFGGWTVPEDVLATVSLLHPESWIPQLRGRFVVSAPYGGLHVCFDTLDPARPLAHSVWSSLGTSWSTFDATTSDFWWNAGDALTNLAFLAMVGSG